MSQITNQKGFTLIELIVAIAIFGALSLVSVQILWDTLSTRSKQYSIENSTSAIRPVVSVLTQSIVSAKSTNIAIVSGYTQIQITGSPCQTFQYNTATKTLEQITVPGAACVPSTSGPFIALTPQAVTITSFTVVPATGFNPEVISITIVGTYKDSLGSHDFTYNFSVSPRVSI